MAVGQVSLSVDGVGLSAVAITTVLCTVLLYVLWTRKKLPPGPHGIPVLGYLPFLGSNPHRALYKLAEKYGDVMSVNLAGRTLIHLNSLDAIKEAFAEKPDEFNGRPDEFCYLAWLDNRLGIGQIEGPEWREQRRFLLHSLRDFGFGNIQLESHIHEVCQDVLKALKRTDGEPYDPSLLLSNCTCNVISSLVFNKTFRHSDPTFQQLAVNGRKIIHGLVGLPILLTGPLTEHVLLKWLPGFSEMAEAKEKVNSAIDQLVQEHVDTFDSSIMRDYTDVFLDRRKKLLETDTPNEGTFTLDRLKAMAMNVFVAGTESVSSSMSWAFRILLDHPDIQNRLQEELDEKIGRARLPSLRDRPSMPYTEAFLSEVQRFVTIFPFTPAHSNPEEGTLKGYAIPKRCAIVANIWSVHHDPKYWPDPFKFDPARFIGPDGKYVKREGYLPFSMGKRICQGESLAQMETFLFLTSILQAFTITSPERKNDSLDEVIRENRTELTFRMCATPR